MGEWKTESGALKEPEVPKERTVKLHCVEDQYVSKKKGAQSTE